MTIGLKFGIVVAVAMTALIVLGILVAVVVPVTAQSPSGNGKETIYFLESAKMHSITALKDLKMGNPQAASTEVNMTHQGIISAERELNASVICDNLNNEGYCGYSPSP